MFKELSYKEMDSEEITDLINIINEEPSDLNSYLLYHLNVINTTLEQLSTDNTKLIELSAVKEMVATLYFAKKVEYIISKRTDEVKLISSEIESVKINLNSIVNGLENVAKIHKENMKEVPPSILFVYLSTGA